MQRLVAGKAKIPQLRNQGLPELSHVRKTVLNVILLNFFVAPASSEHQLISILHPLPSKFTFEQLCLNPYCGTSTHVYHPHQTPSLSSGCCQSNSGLSGSSCASVLLPKLDGRQRSANYVVKSWKIIWNSHNTRNLSLSTASFSYFRSYSHIMWSPMKWKEQAQIHSDLHHGLGTSQHQSSV